MTKIQVYLKLRAGSGQETDKVIRQAKDKPNTIEIVNKEKDATAEPVSYSFDHVFNGEQDSSGTVYRQILQSSMKDLIENKNDITFFTLGPSNSGKSYSLFGKSCNGLLYHALRDLFEKVDMLNGLDFDTVELVYHEILGTYYGGLLLNGNDIVEDPKKKPQKMSPMPEEVYSSATSVKTNSTTSCASAKHVISLSMYEVYNDSIIDLLELTKDYSFLKKQIKKQVVKSTDIFTDPKDGKIKPSNIFTISVSSLQQAMLLIEFGLKNRHVASTNINSQSSRSHLFILLNVHSFSLKDMSKSAIKPSFSSSTQRAALTHETFPGKQIRIRTSRLTISDLAGSERSKMAQTFSNKATFLEGNATNLSLTELGRILNILSKSKNKTKEKSLIRTDKLTRLLLSDYIGNTDNKMMILVNLNPQGDISTISSTLRLISPLPNFKNTPVDSSFSITRLSAFNFRLNFRSRESRTHSETRLSSGPSNDRLEDARIVKPNRHSHYPPSTLHTRQQSNASSTTTTKAYTPLRRTSPSASGSVSSIHSVDSKASTIAMGNPNNSTIAFRRLSMLQKSPPSPISIRNITVTSSKKKNSTSPLVELFIAANNGEEFPAPKKASSISGAVVNRSNTALKQARAHSSPAITRMPNASRTAHHSSLSTSLNASYEITMAPSRKPSSASNSDTKNGSWPSITTITSISQVVDSYLKSLNINIANPPEKIIEKVVFECQTLSDQNAYLKERNQMLEEKLATAEKTNNQLYSQVENVHKTQVAQMADDLASSRIEIDQLESKTKQLQNTIDQLQKENCALKQVQQGNEKTIQVLHHEKQTLLKQAKDLKKQLELSNEENSYLKSELQLANEDLESIKQKFTVLAFQNREYREKFYNQKEVKSNSNSDSTVDESDVKKEQKKTENDRINSFYFANFSFNSTFHDDSTENDIFSESTTQGISPSKQLVEPFFQKNNTSSRRHSAVLEGENLTSNSSAIFEYGDPTREKQYHSSVSNSQYESESETHTNINFSFSPTSKITNVLDTVD